MTEHEPFVPHPTLEELADGNVEALARVLARAFHDDPIQAWLFPDPASRARRQEIMFRSEVRDLGLHHGEVGVPPSGGAVAIWYAPGRWRATLVSQLRQSIPMMRAFGRRLLPVLPVVRTIEDVHPTEPHWYLDWVGVDPARRGEGLSSAVIRPVLDRCDREGLPAYLVSSKTENIPIYEHFGFRVTRQIDPPGGCPPLWSMWRDPDPVPGTA